MQHRRLAAFQVLRGSRLLRIGRVQGEVKHGLHGSRRAVLQRTDGHVHAPAGQAACVGLGQQLTRNSPAPKVRPTDRAARDAQSRSNAWCAAAAAEQRSLLRT